MKQRIIQLLIIGGMVAIVTGITMAQEEPSSNNDLRDRIKQRAEELQQINSQIHEVQNELSVARAEGRTLASELGRIDSQVRQIQLGIQSSEILVEQYGLEVEALTEEIKNIEVRIKDHKEAVVNALQQLQEQEGITPLEVFLRNTSLAGSVFEIQALADVSNTLTQEISDLDFLKSELNGKADNVEHKKVAAAREHVVLQSKEVIVAEAKKEKEILLEQTKNREENYQSALKELKKLQDEINNEIILYEEELRLKIDPSALPVPRPGVLLVPVPQPPAVLTQKYGSTSFVRSRGRTWHNGIDFGAPIGTPIYAPEDGTVIAAGDQDNYRTGGKRLCYKGAYGKFVMVKHTNNLTTMHAHLSRYIVEINDEVKRGDIIGYVGNTGSSTGPHLHFVVYASNTIPPEKPGFPEGTTSSRVCGPLPVGGDLNPLQYLDI